MKVLVIDDEAASRSLIREYLSVYKEIEIAGECVNGPEAVDAITRQDPDLIFLDIQMPGLTGFEVLARIPTIPRIIFTTAYDQYAIKAFDLNAVDYLLKPFTKSRFDEAIKRVLVQEQQPGVKQIAQTLPSYTGTYPERILVESGKKMRSIHVNDIIYLKAEKDFTKMFTADNNYLSNSGIGILEQRLNPEMFCRIHRSYIVNVHAIKELYKDGANTYIVLSNNYEISVSRSYLDNVKRLIF